MAQHKRPIALFAGILIVHFGIWFCTGFSATRATDELAYLTGAHKIIEQGSPGTYWPPGVSFIECPVLFLGGGLPAIRFLWACLSIVATLMLHRVIERLFSADCAYWTTWGFLLYLPARGHGAFAMGEMPALLFFLAALVIVLEVNSSREEMVAFLAGIMLGFMGFVRPSNLLLAFAACWLLLQRLTARSKTSVAKWRCIAILLVAASLPVMAWTVRNFFVHGEAFFSKNVTHNLYLGNVPNYDMDLNLLNPFPSQKQIQVRKRIYEGETTPAPRVDISSNERRQQALAFIWKNPGLFLQRAFGRFARALVPKTHYLHLLGNKASRGHLTLASVLLLGLATTQFGFALFVGTAGLLALPAKDTEQGTFTFILLTAIGTLAPNCIAIAKPRYSFPLAPFLLACAVWFIINRTAAMTTLKKGRRRHLLFALWLFFAWSWIAWIIWTIAIRSNFIAF